MVFGGGGGGGPMLGSGGFFGNAGPSGPYGPYAGCGCSTLFIILAGILLVCAVACACSTFRRGPCEHCVGRSSRRGP